MLGSMLGSVSSALGSVLGSEGAAGGDRPRATALTVDTWTLDDILGGEVRRRPPFFPRLRPQRLRSDLWRA
jgi:hypothetical protein